MIRLRTLGTIGLTDAAGVELADVVRQPKRFALLAFLALSRPRGFQRRDRLLALFWPDLDADRARAALRQSLYTLRRHLPDGVLVTRGDEEVGLAAGTWCDAWAFEAAVEGDRPEEALELYRGDLLDGFHTHDAAPELGYWLDEERERLRRMAVGCAWRLAESTEEAGDAAGVRRWATRAVRLAPLDEEGVRRQIVMLDRAGDRAGAVAAFDQWARRLREELDVEPAPETEALVEAVRARDEARPRPGQGRVSPAAPASPAPSSPAPPSPALGDAAGAPWWRRDANGRWGRFGVGAALLVVAAAVASLLPLDLTWRFGTAEPTATRVAVLPFAVFGSPDVSYLSDGLVYLLSVGLEGEDLRTVDPNVLLRDLDERSLRVHDPTAAARLAERHRAAAFVLGNVVEGNGRIRVSAAIYRIGRPEPVARATATGRADEPLALVDNLTATLLTEWRGEDASHVTRVAALTTDSLEALKAFLHGERLLRRGEYDGALTSFREAVQRDSAFAMAFYRMSLAGSWAFRGEVADRAAAHALEHDDRLPEQERMLLTAHAEYRAGRPEAAVGRARTLTRIYPEDPEAWFRLGETLMHLGPLRGTPLREAREAFERVDSLEGHRTAVLYHLAQLDALMGDTTLALGHIDYALQLAPDGARAPQLRVLRALMAGDDDAWRDQLRALRRADDFTVVSATYMAAVFAGDPAAGRQVAALLAAPSRDAETRAFGRLLLASLELAMGRWDAARAEVEQLRGLSPARADRALALLRSPPWVPADAAELRAIQARLDTTDASEGPAPRWWGHPEPLRALPGWHARSRVALRLGDSASAGALLRDLPAAVPDTALARALARGLRDELSLTRDRGGRRLEPPGPVPYVGSAEHAVLSAHISQPDRRYLQARLLEERGSSREALAWYESLAGFSVVDLIYGVPALVDRARIHERLGERERAIALYRRFLRLWEDADPELAGPPEEARRALERLRSSRDD